MSSKIYNILLEYHICIKLTINAKCCKLLMCSFFMVWHVHDIFEPKLASFHNYLSMEMMNKTECVLGICNAKCYNFLMSSVFVVWLVNDINELELSFFVIISFIRKDK